MSLIGGVINRSVTSHFKQENRIKIAKLVVNRFFNIVTHGCEKYALNIIQIVSFM